MNAKSILTIFSKFFWPEGGGAELATYLIVKRILSKYFSVFIISGTENPTSDIYRYARYYTIPVLGREAKPLDWIYTMLFDRNLKKIVKRSSVVYIPSNAMIPFAIVAKKVNPEINIIIHLHDYQPLTYTSVMYPYGKAGAQDDILTEYYESANIFRTIATGALSSLRVNEINKLALKYADLVICVSRMQCNIIRKHLPWVRRKSIHVYNPLPPLPRIEKELGGQSILLYPGGTSYIKGFHVLLEALPRILKYAKVIITGGRHIHDKHYKVLSRISRETNGRLIVMGRINHNEYVNLHSNARGLLLPSIWLEPLPYSVIEALLLGTPTIISETVGAKELIEDTSLSKFIVRVGDAQDLVDKVHQLVSTDQSYLRSIMEDISIHVNMALMESSNLLELLLRKVFQNKLIM